MTDHAKRIRHALYSGPQPHLLRVQDRLLDEREALAALDALLAENQRLRDERDEWERIAVRTSAEAGNEIRRIRAEALAGDAE